MGYKQEMFRTFLLPLIAAFWMGLLAGGVYYGLKILLEPHFSEYTVNIICLIPSLFIAVFVYFMLVIKLGALNKNEIKAMPKGHLLLRIAEKMHLIHT